MTPKVNKGKRIATGDKTLPPKLVKASREDKLSVIISKKKNKVVCELMTSLSNKYERLKKILGELGLNLVIPKTYIVGLHCHTELPEGVKFVNNLVIEELDHGLFLIDTLRDEEIERLDRETSARVELINSQKVADDLKVLQIDTCGMDLVDAATINAQKIEPTVTLFRVFQTLCKQGDWFSFAKRRAPSPRHLDAAIDVSRPIAGSFNMVDVRRLSAHVIKLKDMPEGVLVLSGLSRVWKSHVCDLVLRVAIEMLWVFMIFSAFLSGPVLRSRRIPIWISKIFYKAKASQKQKASTSGATSSHVAKRTSDDDDDDACVEIPLITPLRSAVMIPSSGNHGGSFIASAAEGSNTRDSRDTLPHLGMFSMMLFIRTSSLFSDGPYYATYHEDGVAGNCEFTREEWDAPYRPTFGVLTKVVFKDLAICKTIVDQFPTPVKMVRVENSRFQGYEEKVANMTGFELQVSALKKHVSGLNDKLSFFDASFAKSKENGKERKRKIKSLTKSLDNCILRWLDFTVQGELLSLAASTGFKRGLSIHRTKDKFPAVLKKMISEYAIEPLLVILQLKPEKLVRSTNVPISKDARVSFPIANESTVTPASKSFELSANVDLTASVVASEHDEEMVSMFFILDDAVELVGVGSGCVSSGPNDVVVALSSGEKGDGLTPSSVASKEAAINPSGV
nr:hypothetical protein [Tanacetum cinerariifolium]